VGKALKVYEMPRASVVILSKVYFGVDTTGSQPPISTLSTNDGPLVNRIGLSRKHIFDAVEASVKRLGTFIDVLQIHRLDRDTPREEIMRYSAWPWRCSSLSQGAERCRQHRHGQIHRSQLGSFVNRPKTL
jgi:aryl-alcohol dehydrogenase-like predicted oxidoreductase